MAVPVVGGYQNFHKMVDGHGPLAAETVAQQAFPYHTFVILNAKVGQIVKQHTLILNPQDFTQREPVRMQVVQTIEGAYVDDFGRGLPKVTISGHTGWRLKKMLDGKGLLDGWTAFKALRNDIFRFYTEARDETRSFIHNPDYELQWYNWGEGEYYAIQPEEFQLQRSASNPLLYQYSFPFTCIRDLSVGYNAGKGKPNVVQLGKTTSVKDAVAKMSVSISALGTLAAAMR